MKMGNHRRIRFLPALISAAFLLGSCARFSAESNSPPTWKTLETTPGAPVRPHEVVVGKQERVLQKSSWQHVDANNISP